MGEVYFIRPGKLALVAHQLGPNARIGLTRFWDLDALRLRQLLFDDPKTDPKTIPRIGDVLLNHSHFIPHATLVLITGEPVVLHRTFNGDPIWYYRVLWGEVDCWVKRDYIIDPRPADNE